MVRCQKIMLTAFLFVSIFSQGIWAFQDKDLSQVYREQPLDIHLQIADTKINEMIQEAQNQGNSEKLNQLEEAFHLLLGVMRNYEYFRTQNEELLQKNWREHLNWSAPSPNTPPLSESPLGLLEHLHLFEDGASQMSANIMIQSVQYSEAQVRQNQALDEAAKLMKSVILSVEKILGTAGYFISQYRIYFEAPLDYKQESTKNKVPINLVKYNSDGSPERNVYISILDADYEISPTAWASKRKEVLQKRYSDLSDFILEEHNGDDYEFKAKYRYAYTWEGSPIKALVLVHKRGQQANLLVCLAIAESFNRSEFDRILASYYH